MKKVAFLFSLLLFFVPLFALADVYIEAEKPADWQERMVFRITVFPTYSNDAMLIETDGKTMLIDGGFKGHAWNLSAALTEMGYQHLDYAFNTHPDDDHIGAMLKCFETGMLEADNFITRFSENYSDKYQRKMMKAIQNAGITYHQLEDGEVMQFGASEITFMYATPKKHNNNAWSCASYIKIGNATMLLLADMPNDSLKYLMNNHADLLDADIMKLPHHGLCYVPAEFLEMVKPDMLFCTNKKNNMAKAVKTEIKAHGYTCINHTAGPIIMETDGTDWYVEQDTTRPFSTWPKQK